MRVTRRYFGLAPDCQQRLAVMEARAAITEVLCRYARGCDRADETLLRDCFWPESTHAHGRFDGVSADFVPYAMGVLATMKFTAHHITNVSIEVRGSRAFSECHFLAHHRRSATAELPERDDFYEGRYLDFHQRRNGVWKIIRRRGLNDFISAAIPASAPFDAWPAGQHSVRGEADAYYVMRRVFEAGA